MNILPTVRLIRLEESTEHGTFGVLIVGGVFFCITLEQADRLNAINISSIPAQQYLCHRYRSTRFGETFIVGQVPGRSNILFHPGNTDDDTSGCMLLASAVGKLRGDRAILNSGATFRRFMEMLIGVDTFHLTVKEEY
jgi:hypothetical protein